MTPGRHTQTKGAALVIPMGSPMAQVRGVVKLPHTPSRRLGSLRTVKQNMACRPVLRTRNPPPRGAGPPPFSLTALRSAQLAYQEALAMNALTL